jgi:Bacterial membrane protein YfhO
VLATHPSWRPVLQDWNATQRRMEAYPDFRFFTNGAYVPFDAIRDLDNLKVPRFMAIPRPKLIRVGDKEFIEYPDHTVPVESGFAGSVEHAQRDAASGGNAVAFEGWAIDEKGGRPARQVLIFVGDLLWGAIAVNLDRLDIAAGFGQAQRRSGFYDVLSGVPPAEQQNIRAFVVLSDATAHELQYSAGYPFTTGFGPAPESLRTQTGPGPGLESVRTGPPIYLHDKSAILPGVPAEQKKLSWSVTTWTPNYYAARVAAPTDGYLLNLENYNPYWKVRVDGQRQNVLRANFTMQAIKLAKGKHLVEWHYDPVLFKFGWIGFYVLFAATLVTFSGSGLRRSVSSAETLSPSL